MLTDKALYISFITELELLSFPEITNDSEKLIKELIRNCFVIDINQDIKDLAIWFRKKSKLKLPDSIIAASSHYHQMPLLTADKQFKVIKDLDLILYDV